MKDIGGYIETNFTYDVDNRCYHGGAVALNSGQSALRYIIRVKHITDIWVPYFTCPTVWHACVTEGANLHLYHIGENFMPTIEIDENAWIIYTNYFGVFGKNMSAMRAKYKNLISDNTMSFFSSGTNPAFYSARNFIAVPDGGYATNVSDSLISELPYEESYNRCTHILKRLDVDSQFGYADCVENEKYLADADVKRMSNLTNHILADVNYEKIIEKRRENFAFLQNMLSAENKLNMNIDDADVPMHYPFLCTNDELRSRLIKNHIFIPQYWGGMEEQDASSFERYLKQYIHALIIDQRYSITDMERIIDVIKG